MAPTATATRRGSFTRQRYGYGLDKFVLVPLDEGLAHNMQGYARKGLRLAFPSEAAEFLTETSWHQIAKEVPDLSELIYKTSSKPDGVRTVRSKFDTESEKTMVLTGVPDPGCYALCVEISDYALAY